MKPEQRFEIHLNGEIPRIGCGRRVVFASVNYKWVYVRRATSTRRVRVPRIAWDQIIEATAGAILRNA